MPYGQGFQQMQAAMQQNGALDAQQQQALLQQQMAAMGVKPQGIDSNAQGMGGMMAPGMMPNMGMAGGCGFRGSS